MASPVSALRTRSAAALVAGAIATAAPADPPMYDVEYLGSSSGASAMNDAGLIAGTTTDSGNLRAWVGGPGAGLTLLPLPPATVSSWASDLNEAGVVVGAVGSYYSPELFGQAAIWQPDGDGGYTVEVLGTLPGHVLSNATALNDVGDVVGYSGDGTYRYPVLFIAPGDVSDLTATGIFDPQDVNNGRVVVDRSFTAKRLFLDTMTVQDLGVPPGSYIATSAAAINESNQVAGVAIRSGGGNCDREAALWSEQNGWEILSSCGYANGAHDINDLCDVVMRLNIAPYVRFDQIGTFLIEDLIISDVGHWYVINTFGLAINNNRQLAVGAHNPTTGQSGVVLLTPRGTEGDVNGDGVVDITDLLILLVSWGPCSDCPADFDGDGVVGVTDLLQVLAGWT